MAKIVALVTPADQGSPSVQAFQDEGTRKGWPAGTVQIYDTTEAQDAHDDVQANGGVLVAAGEMTACAVQNVSPPTEKNPVAIIVAFAGAVPDNANTNMTGFIGDCVSVAKYHLQELKKHHPDVTVMYDPGAHNKVTQNVLKQLNNFTPLQIRPADMVNMAAAQLATQLTTKGFMLIPNAVYYEYASVISDAVDNAAAVTMAYYPEVEYWRKHQNKGKANLYGYNVPLTYRLAASWADNFFTGYWDLTNMPSKKFAKAIPDPYELWIP
jgi:hypothetical protein